MKWKGQCATASIYGWTYICSVWHPRWCPGRGGRARWWRWSVTAHHWGPAGPGWGPGCRFSAAAGGTWRAAPALASSYLQHVTASLSGLVRSSVLLSSPVSASPTTLHWWRERKERSWRMSELREFMARHMLVSPLACRDWGTCWHWNLLPVSQPAQPANTSLTPTH